MYAYKMKPAEAHNFCFGAFHSDQIKAIFHATEVKMSGVIWPPIATSLTKVGSYTCRPH